ncbi:MAG TPA: hypothetical protein VGG10_06375 [Rhizomicrobium sp.]|jgi:hypothetical protein
MYHRNTESVSDRRARTAALAECSFLQGGGPSWRDGNDCAFDEIQTPLSEPSHGDARVLMHHWRKMRECFRIGREIPRPALAPLLANLVVYEPTHGGLDFRARAAGSALLRRFGYDISGFMLSDVLEEPVFERRRIELRALIKHRLPYAFDVQIAARGIVALHFEQVVLPVLAPDGVTPWALSGIFYRDWMPKSGQYGQLTPPLYAMAAR